jgi:nucleoside-triphosphatase THEP1
MKKSVLSIVSELKAALEDDETVVLEIHKDDKHPIIFTITKDCIKGKSYHKNRR